MGKRDRSAHPCSAQKLTCSQRKLAHADQKKLANAVRTFMHPQSSVISTAEASQEDAFLGASVRAHLNVHIMCTCRKKLIVLRSFDKEVDPTPMLTT